jgi:cysteine-rich repeat protein
MPLLPACGDEQEAPPGGQTARLPLAGPPTIKAVAPIESLYIDLQPGGTPVTLSYTIQGWDPFPADGKEVFFYLDGVFAGSTPAAFSFTFPSVPLGFHALSAWLVEDGQPVPLDSARLTRHVRVTSPCAKNADCADGTACSEDICHPPGTPAAKCHWKVEASCCSILMECPVSALACADVDGDGAGECAQCLSDADCDDGNSCSDDLCMAGNCANTPKAASCSADDQCQDSDVCTQDSCDVATCTCVHAAKPGCCHADPDCDDGIACTKDRCLASLCRHAPKPGMTACCTSDAMCQPDDACSIGVCVASGPQAGSCTSAADPAKPGCCLFDFQCKDESDKWVGKCKPDPKLGYSTCALAVSPNWCQSSVQTPIINEVMADPQSVSDSLGEWVEITNAADQPVDLSGYSLVGEQGEICQLFPAAAHEVGPGQSVVVGRVADASLNGGISVDFACGLSLSIDNSAPFLSLVSPEGAEADRWPPLPATPPEPGRSSARLSPYLPAAFPASWQQATAPIPGGLDRGTPGLPNTDLGPLSSSPLCDDGKACSLDLCSLAATNACSHLSKPSCCTSAAECNDKDVCTVDACTPGGTCSHVKVAGCCNTDAECDDSDPCTAGKCLNHKCHASPLFPDKVCCTSDADCIAGDPCVTGSCSGGFCEVSAVPGCCKSALTCFDGIPCTTDSCDPATHQCVHVATPGCCASAADCEAAKPAALYCSKASCIAGKCKYGPPKAGCCVVPEDCNDDNACTVDACDPAQNVCSHELMYAGCCTYSKECPASADPCTKPLCKESKCTFGPIWNCCKEDLECQDSVPCTLDVCIANRCRSIPSGADGCCFVDSSCPPDGLPCTKDHCLDLNCVHTPVAECSMALNYSESFAKMADLALYGYSGFHPGGQAGPPPVWLVSTGPLLGPDGHLELLPGATTRACVASPYLKPAAGTGRVTVGFDVAAEPAGAMVKAEVLVKLGALGAWTTAWETYYSKKVEKHENVGVDLPVGGVTQLRVAFCATPGNTSGFLAIDGVAVAAGYPPQFLTSLPTVSAMLGATTVKTVLAADPDPLASGGTVSIKIASGPSYASMLGNKYLSSAKTFLNRLALAPPSGTAAKSASLTLRATDGWLFVDQTVLVQILSVACLESKDCAVNLPCVAASCTAGACAYAPVVPCCGNGKLEDAEDCDDANPYGGDGCSALCFLEDNDWDGLVDYKDNCPLEYNPDQSDTDSDGTGNACDTDQDGDGVPDALDNCPGVANPGQKSTDDDPLGDACDNDDDNDAVPDLLDNCPLLANESQLDSDADSLGDACDPDDDNDLVPDASDDCPTAADPGQEDMDLDGLGDACDPDADSDGYSKPFDCDDADALIAPVFLTIASDDSANWLWSGVPVFHGDALAFAGYAQAETEPTAWQYDLTTTALPGLPGPAVVCAGSDDLLVTYYPESAPDALSILWNESTVHQAAPGVDPGSIRIHGAAAVWVEGTGTSSEIVLWKEGTRTVLTSNGAADRYPDVEGSRVAWQAGTEIGYFDGAESHVLTSDSFLDEAPVLEGPSIYWTRRDALGGKGNIVSFNPVDGSMKHITNDATEDFGVAAGPLGVAWRRVNTQTGATDVYFHDGAATLALTTGELSAVEALAVGDHVVAWIGTGPDGRALSAWDGTTGVVLDPNVPPGAGLTVSGSRIAWLSASGPVHAVWTCSPVLDADSDGFASVEMGGTDCDDSDPSVAPELSLVDLTQGAADVLDRPVLSDGRAAWSASDGNDAELFLFDGKGVVRLTQNTEDDRFPSAYGPDLVWQQGPPGESVIILFDGQSLGPIPGSKGGRKPQVWGRHVAWLTGAESSKELNVFDRESGTTSKPNLTPLFSDSFFLQAGTLAFDDLAPDSNVMAVDLASGQTRILSTPAAKDGSPSVYGPRVAWLSTGLLSSVMLFDGTSSAPVAQDAAEKSAPVLGSGALLFSSASGGLQRIYVARMDGTVAPLSAESEQGSQPSGDAQTVAWISGAGDAAELVVSRGGTPQQVTDDDVEDRLPMVSRGQVVWLHGKDVFLLRSACGEDIDSDGVPNTEDICPTLYDPNQVDLDMDGLGDTCDPDDDGDGTTDTQDNCPGEANPGQEDMDQDSFGNACDADADADGYQSMAYGGDDCDDLDPSVFPKWTPTVISGGNPDNKAPVISDQVVAWYGKQGSAYRIFMYVNGGLLQVTDEGGDDTDPQVSGSVVTWEHFDGQDREIGVFDSLGVHMLTSNAYDDKGPVPDGANVVWYGFDGNDYEVFRYDGKQTSQITVNARNDYHPRISGNIIVWRGFDGNDYDVFMMKGGILFNISKNDTDDGVPSISGDTVAWSSFDGQDYEIVMWKNEMKKQITDNEVDDLDPMVDGSKVLWRRFDGHDYEVALYTGYSAIQVTDDTMEKGVPKLHAGRVAWAARNGPGDDWEIFTHKAGKTVQVTNNSVMTQDVSPSVRNDTIVWRCSDAVCMAEGKCGK